MGIERSVRAWAAGLTIASAALAGCSSQTNVSMQTSVKSQYTHVWLTIQEVWFNTGAAATPDSTGWNKFTLSAPITVDLTSLTSGALAQIASDLKVPAGTYSQIRLIPLDSSAALASSASALSAIYNSEADYTDSAGTAQRVPLELLNPDKGVGVSTTLTIKASLSQLGAPSATATTGSTCPAGDTDPSCTEVKGTTTTTSSSTPSVSVAVTVDGIHDLVQFAYGDNQTGVLLNPHASAYDVSTTGTIRGSIDTANIGSSVSSSGEIAAEVTAETLSADGSRHVAVKTVRVATDGSFVLYPLSTGSSATGLGSSSSSTTPYDLVIHGPQIQTVIVKSVPVAAGDPSSSAAVSIGTVTPNSASAFTFNLAVGSQALPAGALVNVYQTLPVSGDVPYLIDQFPIDPFSRRLLNDESVPTGTVEWGTYSSGGVSLTTATPSEGASTYQVAGQASLFADGALLASFAPLSSGTGAVQVTMPTLQPGSGTAAGTVSVAVTPSVAGKYDQGELILSHDGAIVQTVAIDSALTQNGGATLQILGVPAGGSASAIDNAVYYLSVRAWNSANTAVPVQRQWYTQPVDLSSGSVTGLSVTVD
jgi:hypothetical protein